ncbi:MAG TPA: PilZ domain-containing protein [Spirochaetota bacterium]|jgi:c-di-GMP-binding flagellar brake protein YcgR|nr:MAG: PilZ domain protein [Spirochaetes bacterium ADurb.Bin133]HNZ28285.1 PilZ domain-containing protein [Spirochaetota bacterium]HOE99922.1 PilZ domain-containing protein [Spirochaetota bacterium]HOS31586.1 PilZ domain-containing protein [Spirochaetota bacterium]HOS54773.1 PilZ domain-containing protein [Spirochaetota bacterium]
MSDSAKDRRKHPRFEINQIVKISLLKETFFNAESVNISEGGILCKSRYEAEPLSQIFIMFDLFLKDKTYSIKSDGVVVHCDRDSDGLFLIGIQFVDIDGEDRDKIREFLEENRE